MNSEDGHQVVRCKDHGSLERARSLVNIQFSWFLVGMVVFVMVFYLVLSKKFEGKEVYVALDNKLEEEDLEAQKKKLDESDSESFVHMGKSFKSMELER